MQQLPEKPPELPPLTESEMKALQDWAKDRRTLTKWQRMWGPRLVVRQGVLHYDKLTWGEWLFGGSYSPNVKEGANLGVICEYLKSKDVYVVALQEVAQKYNAKHKEKIPESLLQGSRQVAEAFKRGIQAAAQDL